MSCCCYFMPGVCLRPGAMLQSTELYTLYTHWLLAGNTPKNIHLKPEKAITHRGGLGLQQSWLETWLKLSELFSLFHSHDDNFYREVCMRVQLTNSTMSGPALVTGLSSSAVLWLWSTNKSWAKTNDLEKTWRSSPLNSVDITHIDPPLCPQQLRHVDTGQGWWDGIIVPSQEVMRVAINMQITLHHSLSGWASSDCQWMSKCQSTNKTIIRIRSRSEINSTQRYQLRHFPSYQSQGDGR